MDYTTTAIFFAITWWLIFFITLPFGVRRLKKPEAGMEPGAPEQPRIWTKAGITTLIAIAITVALGWSMDSGLISLRDLTSS